MNGIALTIASIAVVIAIAAIVIAFRAVLNRPGAGIGGESALLYEHFGSVKKSLDGIEEDQRALARSVEGAHRTLDNLKAQHEAGRSLDERMRASIEHLEHVLSGTKMKGNAGENLLREIFRSMPPEMMATGVRIAGKEVEFGLLLDTKKVLPIDSKWVASDLLASMSEEADPLKRDDMAREIEREVVRRINEVAQYIDPAVTSSIAVAAVPDAAYSLCKTAHAAAFRKRVVLVPYSMVVPYLLTFLHLHRQYASRPDLENVHHFLLEIGHALDGMEEILEHKMVRAKTMMENAIPEYRSKIAAVRSHALSMETSRHAGREEFGTEETSEKPDSPAETVPHSR